LRRKPRPKLGCGAKERGRKKEEILKVRNKVVAVPFLTERHAMKAYWGSRNIDPRFPDLDTRWM
jgi:hypothetical protein